MSKIQVVGLDPSVSNLGIAIADVDLDTLKVDVKEVRLIRTEKDSAKKVRRNSDDLVRAGTIYHGMMEACVLASLAFVELPVGSQSARAMASYGICIGVMAACPIPMIQVLPQESKRVAVGNELATKIEMIAWAVNNHPNAKGWQLRDKTQPAKFANVTAANEHMADAIAAIYAGLQTDQFKQAAAMMRSMRLPA